MSDVRVVGVGGNFGLSAAGQEKLLHHQSASDTLPCEAAAVLFFVCMLTWLLLEVMMPVDDNNLR